MGQLIQMTSHFSGMPTWEKARINIKSLFEVVSGWHDKKPNDNSKYLIEMTDLIGAQIFEMANDLTRKYAESGLQYFNAVAELQANIEYKDRLIEDLIKQNKELITKVNKLTNEIL